MLNKKTFFINEEHSRNLPDGSIVSDDNLLNYNDFIHEIKHAFYSLWEIPSGIQQSYKANIIININYSGWINADEVSFQTNFTHPREYEMRESIANLIGKMAYKKFVLPDFIKAKIHESNCADYTFPFSFEIDSEVVASANDRLKAKS